MASQETTTPDNRHSISDLEEQLRYRRIQISQAFEHAQDLRQALDALLWLSTEIADDEDEDTSPMSWTHLRALLEVLRAQALWVTSTLE